MVSARDLRVAATVDTPRGVPKAGGKSNVGADAVASAPNVVSARVATKATVLLHRPALMTLPATLCHGEGTIHAGNMAKSSPDRTVFKKNSRRTCSFTPENCSLRPIASLPGSLWKDCYGRPVPERPSAPALQLLEPRALAAVTNIAWLEEYDPAFSNAGDFAERNVME